PMLSSSLPRRGSSPSRRRCAGRRTSTTSSSRCRASPPPPTWRATTWRRRWSPPRHTRSRAPRRRGRRSRPSNALADGDRSAYLDALHLLARRELSQKQLRDRLIDREHDRAEIALAIEHLVDPGSLDDSRVARAYVQTALKVKGRGRLRIQRELQEMGIEKEVATAELAADIGA